MPNTRNEAAAEAMMSLRQAGLAFFADTALRSLDHELSEVWRSDRDRERIYGLIFDYTTMMRDAVDAIHADVMADLVATTARADVIEAHEIRRGDIIVGKMGEFITNNLKVDDVQEVNGCMIRVIGEDARWTRTYEPTRTVRIHV